MKNQKKNPSDGTRQLKKAGYVLVGDTWVNWNLNHGWQKLESGDWTELEEGFVADVAALLEGGLDALVVNLADY